MAIDIAKSIAEAITSIGSSAAMLSNDLNPANVESRQAQAAQAAFNQQSANLANSITDNRIASQYAYNSAMAADTNAYNTQMWNQAAAWNEQMWEKQAAFNAEQAQIQRDWQERMANTQYQRAIKDMSKAGLNPILAVTNGGVGTSVPGGAVASVGGASMSSASGAMASGGLVGADQASINNYSGQQNTLAGILGTVAALFEATSAAEKAKGDLAEYDEGLAHELENAVENSDTYVIKPEYKTKNDWTYEYTGDPYDFKRKYGYYPQWFKDGYETWGDWRSHSKKIKGN